MPAHCTAVGKATFAHAPMALTRSIVDSGLRRRSPRTILAPNLFLGQLEGVRRRGFARDVEESAVGISCVAAPVFGADGRPVAAISVTAWERIASNRRDVFRRFAVRRRRRHKHSTDNGDPERQQRADSWRCERVDAHCCHLDEARDRCAGLNDWRLMFCQKVGTCSVVEMITVLWMAVGSLASVVR